MTMAMARSTGRSSFVELSAVSPEARRLMTWAVAVCVERGWRVVCQLTDIYASRGRTVRPAEPELRVLLRWPG